jgi:hypothetical protein
MRRRACSTKIPPGIAPGAAHRAAVLVALASLVSARAGADTFDPALQRLVIPPQTPGAFADPGDATNVAAQVPAAYRTYLSELGTALAPKVLTTADTVGYNGFQFTFDYSLTNISNKPCPAAVDPATQIAAHNLAAIDASQCPWQYAVEGGRNGAGVPGVLHTIQVMARKGIWLPVPSFEIGAGATKLLQSDIWAVQVYGKLSLHEGFHDWPIPSFAVRGAATRVMGASQIDLTMAQIDAELSKSFGVAGTFTLVPYLGAGVLFIVARGQVLDLTPTVDAYKIGPNAPDLNNNAVFDTQDNIIRWRFFGGFRAQYHVLVFTSDLIITPCGDWNGACNADRHKNVKFADNATTQYTFSASAGFLF